MAVKMPGGRKKCRGADACSGGKNSNELYSVRKSIKAISHWDFLKFGMNKDRKFCQTRSWQFSVLLLCNRKDLATLMHESTVLLHKRSAKDTHSYKK